ncbi:MAG TPA: sporulation protein YunB [Anaerovoracaceae bacterium]|nr:sporulation protein YunB [Anaerovoracaceae bacterium]
MWRNQYKGKNYKAAFLFIIIGMILVATACIYKFKTDIAPNIDNVSEIKAKGIITEIVNSTLREEFTYRDGGESLLEVKTGRDGKIQMIEANTELINAIVSDFAVALQNKYDNEAPHDVKVTYGTLIGSRVLSQMGPYMTLKVLPLSVSSFDFNTKLESEGINQSKYKVYVKIKTKVRVLEPFSSSVHTVTNKVLIAEAVILGDVPDSYVVVPEDNILDAIE